MRRFFRFLPLLSVVAALAIATGWRATAQNGRAAPTPTRVASVDLARVFESLEERVARESELKSFIDQQNTLIKDKGDRLEAAKQDLELLVQGSPERRRKAEDVARLRVDLEVQGRFSEQLIDRRRAEVFSALFAKIETAVAALATEQGYDLVLNNDAGAPVPGNTEAETRTAMASRRVLYAGDGLDISDALVRRMNNDWNAGG